ncbi:hypothetical protein [Chryseobacterium sp. R2A-55]|uniref:hypothetical protein n=1 Tax=Chryseobacterium sp. R2A-55 TaxID=2744445 RepID=UPI001F390AAB|nr:hypothetical protein [Chryseobacterium sp. R2A-55]
MRILFLLSFLFCTIIQAQLKLEIELNKNIEVTKEISKKNTLTISITNFSNSNIAFPLNNGGITPFLENESCTDKMVNELSLYSALPMIVLAKEGKSLEVESWFHHIGNNVNYEKSKKRSFYSHLIFLKPYEKYTFQVYFNPHEFYDSPNGISYWYFETMKQVEYNLKVQICINKLLYRELTKRQLKRLSNYKLFEGNLLSNDITYNEDVNYGEEWKTNSILSE